MASTDTWEEWEARLRNSPMGQKHKALFDMLDAMDKAFAPRVLTNPVAHEAKGKPL